MKGQSAIEFLSMVSMSALILAMLYGLVAAKQTDISNFKNAGEAEQTAEKFSFQVEMALVQGEGYSRVFYLQEKLSNDFYNISIGYTNVFLETDDRSYSFDTLYRGDWINVSTSESNILLVYNNGSVGVKNAG